jgi:hypothetical protein
VFEVAAKTRGFEGAEKTLLMKIKELLEASRERATCKGGILERVTLSGGMKRGGWRGKEPAAKGDRRRYKCFPGIFERDSSVREWRLRTVLIHASWDRVVPFGALWARVGGWG